MASHPKTAMKAVTKYARHLFLFGNGDGKPVVSVAKLAELSGAHEKTIRPYMAAWEKEREEISSSVVRPTYAMELSASNLQLHKKDMMFLRDQIQQVKWEAENCDEIIAKLEKLVGKFTENPELLPDALKMLDRYVSTSINKQNLRKQFLSLQSQWTKLSGVEGMMDVGLTKAKEDAKLQAKLDARTAQAEQGVRDVTPEGLSVFKRES